MICYLRSSIYRGCPLSEKTFLEKFAQFQVAYASFLDITSRYSDAIQTETGVSGDWSAREVVAHINGWIVEALRRFPRFAKGTGDIKYNIDAFNAVSIWLRDGKDFDQLIDELQQLMIKVSGFVAEIDDLYTNRDARYGEWLDILTEQAEIHGEELQQFLETKSS